MLRCTAVPKSPLHSPNTWCCFFPRPGLGGKVVPKTERKRGFRGTAPCVHVSSKPAASLWSVTCSLSTNASTWSINAADLGTSGTVLVHGIAEHEPNCSSLTPH